MTDPNPPAAAGWYQDPEGKPSERYWDGSMWTEESRPATMSPVVPVYVSTPVRATVDESGNPVSPKSRLAAALLAWFLGIFGIHRFYVGKVGTGIAQIFTLGGLGVWALVDFIMILVGSFKDKQERKLINWT